MSVFYVFQGETYDIERRGEYVWSPKLAKGGRRNAGYTMMTNVHRGDFILHNSNGRVMAISIAETDCYDARQPRELANADTSVIWDEDGYRIDTHYYDVDIPLSTADYQQWLKDHYIDGSAFTTAGRGKQQYMCALADEHAILLLEHAIGLQRNQRVLKNLRDALSDIVGDKDSEYNSVEMESINEIVDDSVGAKPSWPGKREEQAMTTSPNTGREIPFRDPKVAANALMHADYQCEYNKADRTFLRKSGKPYTEPHHLIPISRYRDFDYSVDVMENIVSLCSHCHNLLHYGRFQDKIPVLRKLYNDRRNALARCGISISFDQLADYYK